MAALAKIRKYRRKIDGLAEPIKENLERVAELDKDCRAKQRFVEGLAIPTVQAWTDTPRDIRQRRYKLLKSALDKLEKQSIEKVNIATQSYEFIDSHVVQLDRLYQKITQQAVKAANGGPSTSTATGSARRGRPKANASPEKDNNFDPTNFVNMVVDPHEPTYCVCQQVSYGQMISCDNPECAIDWYHFDCVGLTKTPAGKWFCPTCRITLNKPQR